MLVIRFDAPMRRHLPGLVLRGVRPRLLWNGGICGSDLDFSSQFHRELDDRGAFTYHHVDEWCGKEIPIFALALALLQEGKVDLG